MSEPSDWNRPDWDRLWLYNLHYFDNLVADCAQKPIDWDVSLLERWLKDNPPADGCGWEPYPLSIRIVNWIKWDIKHRLLDQDMLDSLAVQSRHLYSSIEWHLYGNHLLTNAKALVFAGLYFSGPEASNWLREGLRILDDQLPEQILKDGGHFERSTMYHCLVLEDVLDLINIVRHFGNGLPEFADRILQPTWRQLASKMTDWMFAMCHPDERISFFNDASFGIAPEPRELAAYSGRLGSYNSKSAFLGLNSLPDSGYIRASLGAWTVFFDVAPVGPDYIPGHAHADTLSIELSWNSYRLLVNSGTSTYTTGKTRSWERSTTAHNTVTIDGIDSSETWASFRVGRRARPFGVSWGCLDDGTILLEGKHDGYRHLHGHPVHHRKVEIGSRSLRWKDCIFGEGVHEVSGYLHFHPQIRVTTLSPNQWHIDLPSGDRLVLLLKGKVAATMVKGSYSAEFGRSSPRDVLLWRWKGMLPLDVSFEIITAF